MKKLTKVMALTLASACCFSGLVACNKEDSATKKTVTIGYTDYAPMNYEDENGNLIGFDTELAKKAFGDLGYQIRFKLIEWSNKYAELNSGTIDCVWNGFTANCADDDGIQRADKVDFSYNYMRESNTILSNYNPIGNRRQSLPKTQAPPSCRYSSCSSRLLFRLPKKR